MALRAKCLPDSDRLEAGRRGGVRTIRRPAVGDTGAGFQPAVSRVSNPLTWESPDEPPTGKSAIQQTGSLRYQSRAAAALALVAQVANLLYRGFPTRRRAGRGLTARWLGAAAWLGLGAALGWAESGSEWRVYQAANGLSESLTTAVTISPRGNVWAKHGEVDVISLLDGYTVQHLPAPGERNYRIHQSRAGKVWSIGNEGILEWVGERWLRYPIEEVRREHELNAIMQIRQTPLLPAEEDRVLLVLPDRLVEYRTLSGQLTVLRRTNETMVGRFNDLTAARDDGVWVSAARGLLKFPGPLRRLGAATPCLEHVIPGELQVRNLQRPFEDDDGGITTVGDSIQTDRRVLVHFDGVHWLTRPSPGENLRYAWRDLERGRFWGLTLSSLVRFLPENSEAVRESLPPGQFFDVATQPGGVFWVATVEGLLRHAPVAWRTPRGAASFATVVHAMLEVEPGQLWFAGASSLLSLREGAWQEHRWPDHLDLAFRARDGLFALPNGTLVLGAADQVILFDRASEQFRPLLHPAGRRLKRILCEFPGHQLCLQTAEGAAPGGDTQLELYDGAGFRAFTNAPPPPDLGSELFFLGQARNGDLWAGGSGGPAVWREKKWQKFGPPEGYLDEGALCWLEGDTGAIWCAGLGKISEFDGKRWTTLRTGLDRVSAMFRAADGSTYVAAGSGLHRFHKESWSSVAEEEGLPGRAAYCALEDAGGHLWVGASRGLAQHFPRADIDPPRTLALEVDPGTSVSAEGVLRVAIQGVDRWQYTPRDRLLYSHRLDEANWSPFAPEAELTFRDLAAGKHRLEVRAMDRNWNVEPKPAVLEFAVIVPWYRDPRLIAVTTAAVLGVFFFAGLAVNRHVRLRRSYAEVEKKVSERTRELQLAIEELAHSQKMTALGTLAAGIAHDFNNILSIVRGSAQIIETNLDDREKILTRVARIKTTVDQGAGIVRAMLGFGRVSDRRPAACDVEKVVEETLRLLGDRFLREVSIRRELAGNLPEVRGIKQLMQQTLLNLILNAADALAGTGEIRLRTGLAPALPSHLVLSPAPALRYVYVAVSDNGCGIAPETLPRIFEPFFTTKAFSSRHGTGLGLYTVYEFAKEAGHGLLVESEPGKGSTFTIFMPVLEPPSG